MKLPQKRFPTKLTTRRDFFSLLLVRSLKWHGQLNILFFTVEWTIWMKMIDKVSMVPQCKEKNDITMKMIDNVVNCGRM